MNKFDVDITSVCSLGILCHTTDVLNRSGLKKCSYPFDWVFSDWNIIADCLENNFEKFLDKTLYSDPVFKFTDRQCGHKSYHQDFFFHKNPRDREDDYEYYKRCITRFDDLLKSDKQKLFVILIVPHGTREPLSVATQIEQGHPIEDVLLKTKNEIVNFKDTLKKHTSNFKVLAIFAVPDQSENSHKFTIEDDLHFVELYTKSKSNGKTFIDESDNVYLDGIIRDTYNFIDQ